MKNRRRLLYCVYVPKGVTNRAYVVKTYLSPRDGFITKVIHEDERGFKTARALAVRGRAETRQKVG